MVRRRECGDDRGCLVQVLSGKCLASGMVQRRRRFYVGRRGGLLVEGEPARRMSRNGRGRACVNMRAGTRQGRERKRRGEQRGVGRDERGVGCKVWRMVIRGKSDLCGVAEWRGQCESWSAVQQPHAALAVR